MIFKSFSSQQRGRTSFLYAEWYDYLNYKAYFWESVVKTILGGLVMQPVSLYRPLFPQPLQVKWDYSCYEFGTS